MAFNFPDGASSGDTHTASNGTVYRYNGTTWVVDSATTTSTFDLRYLNTGGDGIVSGSSQITDGSGIVSGSVISSLPSGTVSGSSQITDGSGILSGSITSQLPSGVISGSTQITDGSGILSGSITSQLPSGVISGSTQITSTDLDMGGNKVLFGNVYSTLGDLPNASTYHGMFAHVHAEGKGYFAHGGNWIPLANGNDNLVSGSSQIDDLGFLKVDGDGVVSGSSQLDGFVSSSSASIIEVMTSASYAAITPVSGTLYIIQG